MKPEEKIGHWPEPSHYPSEGSVRALMAFSLVGTVIVQTVRSGDIPEVLAAIAGMAIVYYFKLRDEK
jgi:hypothetical protein